MIELLWVRDVASRPVKPPGAILSCASPKIVADWRKRNTWADNVPLTLFGDFEMGPFGDIFNDFPYETVPWKCENASARARDTFVALRGAFADLHHHERAWELYKMAVRAVCGTIPPGAVVWVIAADADQGLMAVVAADERASVNVDGKSYVAAIASGDVGLIGASVAAELGVNVAVVDKAKRIYL